MRVALPGLDDGANEAVAYVVPIVLMLTPADITGGADLIRVVRKLLGEERNGRVQTERRHSQRKSPP